VHRERIGAARSGDGGATAAATSATNTAAGIKFTTNAAASEASLAALLVEVNMAISNRADLARGVAPTCAPGRS
jgi:hypothetical protein